MWYILKKGKPVKAKNIKTYSYWDKYSPFRVVDQKQIGEIYVSTVFLGLDHGYGLKYPILWETMIFGEEYNHYQEKYTSIEAARIGHKKAVELVLKSIKK